MPTLSGLTIQQLRAATVTEIRTAMKARLDQLTKRQLIRLDLWVASWDQDALVTLPDQTRDTYHPDRQIASRTEVTRDVLGAKTGSRRVDWTYFPSGCVQDILITELDAADEVASRQRIHHFEDGRQPEVV